ncbi:DUF1792 domain-containing protein [Apilactobacillus kunkeei]|nr:DUF1792 domain-containing protein [Apilactobacillus kunkeei]TMT04241.1 DUF1792 domain-containing protein [Apilactobacillus kunkeei]
MKIINTILQKYQSAEFRIYRITIAKMLFNRRNKKISDVKIKSINETAKELLKTSKSIGRYGDGELSWMIGKNNGVNNFQKKSNKLSIRLREVFDNNREDFLITLPDAMVDMNEKKFTSGATKFWKYYITKKANKLSRIINREKTYYNTSVTRPYIDYNSNVFAENAFNTLKGVWKNKNILIVEGNQSRLGYNDDLFSECSQIKRIECPATNAFESYDEIFNKALQFLEKNNDYLTLISLGPTATILAYDLCCKGYRAIDVGHIDVEYEWFLLGAKEKINLPDKYVNEMPNGKEPDNLVDNSRDDEIIFKI